MPVNDTIAPITLLPRGTQGLQGGPGIKGDKGDPGPAGPAGPTGLGLQGIQGLTGGKGDKGDKGDPGPIGLTGAKGDTGTTGPAAETSALNAAVTSAQGSATTAQGAQSAATNQATIVAALAAAVSATNASNNNFVIEDLYDGSGTIIPWALTGPDNVAWVWSDAAGAVHWVGQPDFSALAAIDTVQNDPDWIYVVTAQDASTILCGFRSNNVNPALPAPGTWYFANASTAAAVPNPRFTAYGQRVVTGQSNATGDDAFVGETGGLTGLTVADTGWGNVRFQVGYNTRLATDDPIRPANRPAAGFAFVPGFLPAGAVLGETPGPGFADSLKAAFNGFYAMADQSLQEPRLFSTCAARGSLKITAYDKRNNSAATYIGACATSFAIAINAALAVSVAAGLPLAAGSTLGLVSTVNGLNYVAGVVVSYSGTNLVLNVDTISGSGTLASWSLVRDAYSLPGNYYAISINDVQRGHDAALALGKSHAVCWWSLIGGERAGDFKRFEYDAAPMSMSAAVLANQTDIANLAVDYDADIRAITGQKRLFGLTYQTSSQPAAQAQLQAASNNRLLYMVGPHYAMPSAINSANTSNGTWRYGSFIHWSASKHQWWDDMEAKVGYRILQGENWKPCYILRARKVDATTLDVDVFCPRGPLVIDTSWFPKLRGWGLALYAGSWDAQTNYAEPTNAVVLSGTNTVRLTFAAAIPAGAFIGTPLQYYYDLGANPVVASVAAGPAEPLTGYSQYSLTLAVDFSAQLAPLVAEGAFQIVSGAKGGVIRSVAKVGGVTVLTGTNAAAPLTVEQTGGAFAAGDILSFASPQARTNFRDSGDNAQCLHTFTETAWGTRQGQPYPMDNWLAFHLGVAVTGA